MDTSYKWHVLVIVMIGTLMAALDTSIVNISLPDIMADFGAAVDDIEWVITGYMLAFATLMPLTAWLRGRIGHRALYLASLAVFTIGSLLCGLAWNLPSLIVARVIQALGAGAITPTGMAMISEVFEPHERGTALGYWGIGVVMGPAFGPTLGGFLTQNLGWRSIFMVNLPIGIIGILLGWYLLRRDRPLNPKREGFDVWGFAFLTFFLLSFLLGLSRGEREGWQSGFIVMCWITAVAGLVGFLVVESSNASGIIDLRLFRYPVFAACMTANLVRSVALFGGVFLLPLFLQQVQGLDETQSGLLLLPGALLIAVIMPIAGKLSDLIGPRWPAIFGLIGVALFLYLYRRLDVNTSKWGIIYPMLVRGVGLGLLMTPINVATMNSVPRPQAGMASAMLNLVQQVGGSLGIAVLGSVLSHRTTFHLGHLGAISGGSPAFRAAARALTARAHTLGYAHTDSLRVAHALLAANVQKMALVAAFEDAFLVGTVIVVIGIFPAWLLPNKPVERGPGTMVAE